MVTVGAFCGVGVVVLVHAIKPVMATIEIRINLISN
jgi:hypothetical protein